MSTVKFTEVLNDLVDYFLVGDPYLLMDFKKTHHLPDDLISVFTTTEDGDRVVKEGVMIPLSGVANYPYTIYFNLNPHQPQLLQEGNNLQIQASGYTLQVKYGTVFLYTIPYIRNFTEEILQRLTQLKAVRIDLPNGWYKVAILGGETKQETGMEPTFEFVITPTNNEPLFTADISHSFTITASEY